MEEKESHLEQVSSVSARVVVWVALFALLFVLRSFFLLIFLTFVFSYLQAHGEHLLAKFIARRSVRVILVALFILGILISAGSFLVPRVKHQARLLADHLPEYVRSIDRELEITATEYPLVGQFISPALDSTQDSSSENWTMQTSHSALIAQQFLGLDSSGDHGESVGAMLEVLRGIGRALLAAGSAFLLGLLFSFLIVLDLPRLSESVRGLKYTRLRFIYEEVGNGIFTFGTVLGRSLEAQMIIAFVNTMLTAVVIHFLGIGDSLAFLSVIVFICGFIPVAGVFISSVPICLLSVAEQGAAGLLFAVLSVWLIHLTEAYILNPRIFGKHLHVNPVLVLMILTVGGKLFGVWGLVLGLPVCTYFFQHAIRENAQ